MKKEPSLWRRLGCQAGYHRYELIKEFRNELMYECEDCKGLYLITRENLKKIEELSLYEEYIKSLQEEK